MPSITKKEQIIANKEAVTKIYYRKMFIAKYNDD